MNGEGSLREKELLEQVLATLSSLTGVRKAFYLDDDLKRRIGEIEAGRSTGLGPLTVHNEGVLECLRHAHVACIVKDTAFRPPPAPTVVLLNEEGTVVGRELIANETPEARSGQKLIYLGKDFVIFYEEGRSSRTRFVLPAVSFAEVEALDYTANVCSSSPSTDGDSFLRRSAGLPDDPKLATILIGFDLQPPSS